MKLIRSTAVVSGMTLVSRVFGFVRDMVVARTFGASAATDAFFVALRIPNLLRRLFAEGSFSMAFVPVLSEYRERGNKQELKSLIDAVAGAVAATLLIIVGIGIAAAAGFVWIFAPGFGKDPALFQLTETMLRITFPYALFISLTAMAGGILNTFGRFAIPAFTPVLLNLALIAAALAAAPYFDPPIVALAWGVFLAGVLQLVFQIPALMRLGLLPRPRLNLRHEGVRRIGRLMVPTLIGSSAAQINVMVDTLIASMIATGAISWLYYADRLLEFPLGLFGIAISTVMLPSLSRRHCADDRAGYSRTLDWGLRLGSLIAIPAALGLGLLAAPIVATLFHHGEFTAESVRMTAASVVAYALGLPGYVGVKVLAPAFYSRQDTRTPVRIAIIAVSSNVLLNLLFVALLYRFPFAPPHAGLALASSLSAFINAGLLYRALRRHRAFRPLPGWGRHLFAIGVAGALMSAFLWWQMSDWQLWPTFSVAQQLQEMAVLVIGGIVIYGLVALAFGGIRREILDAPI